MKPSETADSGWKGLYRVGGAAALIIAVLLISRSSSLPSGRNPAP
jgi:hypothetical protein